MNNINLYNRYDDKFWLEYLSNNWWKLNGDLSYTRLGAGDDNWETINFIDPPGGPFMQVESFSITTDDGKKLILKEIKQTDKGYILRFE